MSTLLWVEAGWTEPPEDDWRNAKPNKRGKSPEELHGNVHHIDEYFQGNLTAPVPWKQQTRLKTVHDYDPEVTSKMLSDPDHPITEVDPRILKASQGSITRSGVQHYSQDGDHHKTGKTFADHGQRGNAHPIVYVHHNGDHVLLSGHHRAAAALFEGRPLRAKVVRGGRPPR